MTVTEATGIKCEEARTEPKNRYKLEKYTPAKKY